MFITLNQDQPQMLSVLTDPGSEFVTGFNVVWNKEEKDVVKHVRRLRLLGMTWVYGRSYVSNIIPESATSLEFFFFKCFFCGVASLLWRVMTWSTKQISHSAVLSHSRHGCRAQVCDEYQAGHQGPGYIACELPTWSSYQCPHRFLDEFLSFWFCLNHGAGFLMQGCWDVFHGCGKRPLSSGHGSAWIWEICTRRGVLAWPMTHGLQRRTNAHIFGQWSPLR